MERKKSVKRDHRDWSWDSPDESYHNCDFGSEVGLAVRSSQDGILVEEAVER